jgi:hypothetical protein
MPMTEIEIPHAEKAFIDESGSPYDVLRVVTKLPRFSKSPGFNAEAKDELLRAIAAEVERWRVHTYDVRWADSDNTSRKA